MELSHSYKLAFSFAKNHFSELCTQLDTTESVTHVQYKVKRSKVYRKVSVRHTALLLCAKAVFPLCRLDVIYNIGLYSAPIIVTQWTCLLKQVNAVFVSVIFFKTAFVLNINNWDRAVIMCTLLLRSHSLKRSRCSQSVNFTLNTSFENAFFTQRHYTSLG